MGLEFTFPSIYDGAQIQCRIELPANVDAHNISARCTSWKPRASIIAHPYQPLGGSCDDPVVRTVARELLRLGYVVGTFNFRGAGQSQGKTSWTGRGEMGDYTSFCIVMMEMIVMILARKSTETSSALEGLKDMEFVLAGYSYGSMIASNLPSSELIWDLFLQAHGEGVGDGDADVVVSEAMHQLMLRLSRIGNPKKRNSRSPNGIDGVDDNPMFSVSYLLISPILPPIASFTTLSFLRSDPDLTFTSSSPSPGGGIRIASTTLEEKIRNGHRVLALFGDADRFCSVSKLREWSARMKRIEGSQFQTYEVEGGSHFWATKDERITLREMIRRWC
ncbi:hypothetical protein KEM54_006774 [Ascosphaera aggregata]|nr:hypothetical protein KEM54_006774 [Ascosphaera aggregata]